jgi:hypothetical protein
MDVSCQFRAPTVLPPGKVPDYDHRIQLGESYVKRKIPARGQSIYRFICSIQWDEYNTELFQILVCV